MPKLNPKSKVIKRLKSKKKRKKRKKVVEPPKEETPEEIACTTTEQISFVHPTTIIDKELAVCGWLRYVDILNTNVNYKDITNIIASYIAQGYAKYYDGNSDISDMGFGDILKIAEYDSDDDDDDDSDRRLYTHYRVLGLNYQLISCGAIAGGVYESEFINIRIPISITKHLDNAVEFYSKFDQDKEHFNWFKRYGDDKHHAETGRYIAIKPDDQFVIQHFGGPLLSKYISKIMYLLQDKDKEWRQERLDIFAEDGESHHMFKPWINSISYKDVDKYFEIRDDTTKLIILRVPRANIDRYDHPKNCETAVSNIWERRFNPDTQGPDYIGPKEEGDAMLLHLKDFYKNDPITGEISIVDKYDRVDNRQFIYILDTIK